MKLGIIDPLTLCYAPWVGAQEANQVGKPTEMFSLMRKKCPEEKP